jgi:hypothetical protein
MNRHSPLAPWWVRLITDSRDPETAIAAAMRRALERAFFDPRHAVHRKFFSHDETPTAEGEMRP